MTKHNFDFLQAISSGGNPHDYFGRVTLGDPLIAANLLCEYGDSVIAEHVDLKNLQAEPTQFFGPPHPILGPKEVILDVPYIAHLHDKEWNSEVLIMVEHKSSPNLFCPLQLCTYAQLSLYKRWTDAGRPASRRKFKLPIPLMVLLYCGAEDLSDEMISYQDIFEHVPEALKLHVPQFRLLVINLRRFDYAHLPGKPETQAVVETMKRAFDGTLAEHFPDVLGRLTAVPIDDRIMDLIANIAWYSGRVTDITPEKIVETVTNVVKGKEGVEMAEMIKKGIYQQGRIEESINKILKLLQLRFNQVPDEIANELNSRTDLIALDSLFALAFQCKSLDEFANALK